MSLEFAKLIDQVQTMGRFLGSRDTSLSARLEIALEMFYAANDLTAVHERINLVRKSSVSGYRGATALNEVVCDTFPTPPLPSSATLVAVDGGQVYPDPHAATQYYLLNLSWFVSTYGEVRTPLQGTEPQLVYSDDAMSDADGRLISNMTVNARRTLAEMQILAKQSWTLRGEGRPLMALHDGGLLKFFGAHEVTDAAKIKSDYMSALQQLQDTRAVLMGYIDRPRSTYLISLLHLLSLEPDQINDFTLKTNGPLEGLNDTHLYSRVLKPGERSALVVQNSPQNREYKDENPDFEIASFYLNVSDDIQTAICRIDLPMWVARDEQAVDDLHAVILAQCGIQGRRHYPYALTRADELAYIGMGEKQQLEQLIGVELLKNRVEREASNKLQTKGLARGSRTQHRIGSR